MINTSEAAIVNNLTVYNGDIYSTGYKTNPDGLTCFWKSGVMENLSAGMGSSIFVRRKRD